MWAVLSVGLKWLCIRGGAGHSRHLFAALFCQKYILFSSNAGCISCQFLGKRIERHRPRRCVRPCISRSSAARPARAAATPHESLQWEHGYLPGAPAVAGAARLSVAGIIMSPMHCMLPKERPRGAFARLQPPPSAAQRMDLLPPLARGRAPIRQRWMCCCTDSGASTSTGELEESTCHWAGMHLAWASVLQLSALLLVLLRTRYGSSW